MFALAAEVFVPLQIAGGGADADDIRAAIAVDIGFHASGACHTAIVDELVLPIFALVVLCIEDVNAFSFAAIAGNDVIKTIAVEIAHDDFVALGKIGEDYFSAPGFGTIARIDDHFIAMPWLNGSKEASAVRLSHGDVARAFGAGSSWPGDSFSCFHWSLSPRPVAE